ncbi:NUDIX hydrolase [Pseudomarimonas salicorniae]|uniref:Phosphatase NudJ n=1 Tax=Pseudomarimonas salicorniae TaxID=2933270 RepID=A0ABT0GIZ3_9GAMM|nr:NUDIX hydrolase [Lysobacter sp. CAU 1642]MCK7594164.1 NUDIX hydrolase [Lysobacter sp. CAU 1642]
MNSLPFPNPAETGAAPFHPDLTVACVIHREGRFLLVEERVRGELVLNQPAGHVEAGESLVDAAVRETLEESGWEVRLTGLVGVYQWQAPDGIHFLRFAFAAEALHHHAERPLDTGIERALWLSPEEMQAARSRLRSPLVMQAVDDALAAPPLPLDRIRAL